MDWLAQSIFYNDYMKNIFYALISLLILSACGKEKKSSAIATGKSYNFLLKKKDKVTIAIDSSIYPIFFRSQYLPKTNDLIVANSREELVRIDLDSNKLVGKIHFEKEGENSTKGAAYNFYYHNKDSIFLMGQKSKTFYLTNFKGEVKNLVRLPNIDENINTYGEPMLGMGNTSGAYKENTLYVLTYPIVAEKMAQCVNDPVFIGFNLEKNEVKKGDVKYEYSFEYDPLQHPAFIMPLLTKNDQEKLVLLFKTDNNFLIEEEDGTYEKISFSSDYVEDFPKMEKMKDIPVFEVTASNNERLLTNPRTGHHYLFLSHGINHIDESTGEPKNFYSKPFSVLVFDRNFKKLVEQKFPANTYNLNSSFVSNNRLYLSLNNPENEEFDEDHFKFETFQLEELL